MLGQARAQVLALQRAIEHRDRDDRESYGADRPLELSDGARRVAGLRRRLEAPGDEPHHAGRAGRRDLADRGQRPQRDLAGVDRQDEAVVRRLAQAGDELADQHALGVEGEVELPLRHAGRPIDRTAVARPTERAARGRCDRETGAEERAGAGDAEEPTDERCGVLDALALVGAQAAACLLGFQLEAVGVADEVDDPSQHGAEAGEALLSASAEFLADRALDRVQERADAGSLERGVAIGHPRALGFEVDEHAHRRTPAARPRSRLVGRELGQPSDEPRLAHPADPVDEHDV